MEWHDIQDKVQFVALYLEHLIACKAWEPSHREMIDGLERWHPSLDGVVDDNIGGWRQRVGCR
jgi:hypothetical protein